jgi:hypothetical protein
MLIAIVAATTSTAASQNGMRNKRWAACAPNSAPIAIHPIADRAWIMPGRTMPLPNTTAGLWALRVFVVLVSLMVIYTFIDQLH